MERAESSNRLEAIWGVRLLDDGYTQIPNALTRNYRRLGIEHGEWGFICILLTFKHDVRDPYPSRKTIAEHLNCTERQIDKWVKSLREKGFLRIGERRNPINKQWGATVYSLKPLIDACLKLLGEESFAESVDYEIKWEDENSGPEVRKGSGPEVRKGSGPEVRKGSGPEVRTKITTKKEKEKKKKENNNSSQDVVVVPESIKVFFSDRNIPVADQVISDWLKIADEGTILQAATEAISKKKKIETIVGYIGGMLKKGYSPSVTVNNPIEDKLPESVRKSMGMAAEEIAAAAGESKLIADDPELSAMLESLKKRTKG